MRLKPLKQTCAGPGCSDVACFVVAVAARDGGIRTARRCCGEHLEEAVFWAEGIVDGDARSRYALVNRWGPWMFQLGDSRTLREVPA